MTYAEKETQGQFGAFFFVLVPLVLLSSLLAAWVMERVMRHASHYNRNIS